MRTETSGDSPLNTAKSKIEFENYTLEQTTYGQTEIILDYMFPKKKQTKAESEILKEWMGNLKERDIVDRHDGGENSIFHAPKYRPISKVAHEMKVFFGEDENRRLRPGEEASVIKVI